MAERHFRGLAASKRQPSITISPAEYDTLPPSIKKKYFSSQERLEIAQRAAAEKRQRHIPRKAALPSSTDSASPTTLSAAEPKLYAANTSSKVQRQLRRRSSMPADLNSFKPHTNGRTWFDTVSQKSLLTPSDRPSINSQQTSGVDVPARDEPPHTPSPSSSLMPPNMTANAATHTSTTAQIPAPIIGNYSRRKYSTLSNDTIASHHAHPHITTEPSPVSRHSREDSTQRSFSLRPLPLPPPILAPVPHLLSPDTSRLLNEESLQLGHQSTTVVDGHIELAPELKSYHDPPARETLNQQIAPDRFEKAIEHGFQFAGLRKPSTSSYDPWEHPRNPSPMSSGGASVDSQGPMTPTTTHEAHVIDLAPFTSHNHPREVTVKLALSRPHKRVSAEEEAHVLNSHNLQRTTKKPTEKKKDDPYALQAIEVCDDHTGAHGAFAVHNEDCPKGLKRVFKPFWVH